MSENTAIDKLARFTKTTKKGNINMKIKKRGKEKFVLPAGMTVEDIQKYLPKFIKSMQKENTDERKDNREDKAFALPINYAVIPSSTFSTSSLMDSEYNADIGMSIVQEIINYGRQTIEELIGTPGDEEKGIPAIQGHLTGWEKPLLVTIINSLIKDNYLEWYREKDGTVTLEGVDRFKRLKALGDSRTKEEIEEDDRKAEERMKVNAEGATSINVGTSDVSDVSDTLNNLEEKILGPSTGDIVEKVEVTDGKIKLNPRIRFGGSDSS